jgi:hypothetical protein
MNLNQSSIIKFQAKNYIYICIFEYTYMTQIVNAELG